MKSVGIIGGLGPETTSEFYLEVIFQCQKLDTMQRPLIVIASVPLLYEIERDLLTANTGTERYIPFLVNEAKRLERSGVDFLVMPCNSLHVFINEIRDAVSIPVLSIVEETAKYVQEQGFKRIGLISTSATVANNVYEKTLDDAHITYMVPDDLQKASMDKIIQRLISGQHLNSDRELILSLVDDLTAKGVDAIALACTDLQLLLPSSGAITIFDTMKILATSTATNILL